MVENGKPMGLTGAFQSVQWGAITTASILVGVLGGYLAEYRRVHAAFFLAACFPLVSLLMAAFFVRESPAREDREAFAATWAVIREALREREVWVVGGFIFFWTFSPSFGPALLYYQTDRLHFSQQFIGHTALSAAAGSGAFIYAPHPQCRSRLIFSIGAAVAQDSGLSRVPGPAAISSTSSSAAWA
jgi:MFS family permease